MNKIMANNPATLTPGDYEMTQNANQDDSKEYFVLKLTDSAYRAIEDYQNCVNKKSFTDGQRALMQMNGNSGVIHIPTLANKEGHNFGFSVDAVEGSLECVQQTADGLDVLGPIPYRMRIHANDDVYAETRNKMAIAGETERNKSTKVIKPNKDEIGRKVRKPVATLANQHLKNNESHDKMHAKLPTRDVKSSKTDIGRPLSTPVTKPSPTLTTNNVISNNRASVGQYKSPAQKAASTVKESANEVKPTKNKPGRPPGSGAKGKASSAKGNNQPDITRCKIRERVIQMLAVRPYKKLELYTRLQNEGLRDCERSVIGTVLRDIALLRDNAYNLRRHIWNDVKEDWPFYSEQERQQLKRNKPQNLSPPITSDAASSTSGQSPPALNSPSPPQQHVPESISNGGNSLKRPSTGYYDPVPSKKQRISHVLTKERVGSHMTPPNANNLVHPRNTPAAEDSKLSNGTQISTDCATKHTKSGNTSKPPTQRKKKPAVSDQQPAKSVSEEKSSASKKSSTRKSKGSSKTKPVDADAKKDELKGSEKPSSDIKKDNQNEAEKQYTKNKKDKRKEAEIQCTDKQGDCEKQSEATSSTNKETARKSKKTENPASSKKLTTKPEKTAPIGESHGLKTLQHVENQRPQYGASQQQVTAQEPVAQSSAVSHILETPQRAVPPSSQHEEPQQQRQQGFNFSSYTPITCVEQRRMYKAEFERDYVEYNQLLERVENVRRNFQILTSQLQQLPTDSPSYAYIHQQIVEEYERVNSADELQRKQRFDYLHAKLAHITQLVTDYDKMLTSLAEAAAIEAAVLQHRRNQHKLQQRQLSPIQAAEDVNPYAVEGTIQSVLTSDQQNNGHVSPMETNNELEKEVPQPSQVLAPNTQQHKINGAIINKQAHKKLVPSSDTQQPPQVHEPITVQLTNQAQLKNVARNSAKTVAPSSGPQLIPQHMKYESERINAQPNDQEDDSSSSDSDNSSDSSSDDSSDESSSDESSSESSDDSD